VDIVLIAGLWLDASAWDAVVPALTELGHRPVAVPLPGQGDGARGATLADQVAAVLAAVDATEEPPVVVGHSAAATLAWLAADARPDRIGRVVLIGGFPASDGTTYADFFEPVDGLVPFPGWAPFEGPDAADLDEEARRRFEQLAVPVPVGVSRAPVRYRDERRSEVPTTLVCPEFTPDDVRTWLAGGDLPELAGVRQLELVDLGSGHWPMLTRPVELARLLAAAAAPDVVAG